MYMNMFSMWHCDIPLAYKNISTSLFIKIRDLIVCNGWVSPSLYGKRFVKKVFIIVMCWKDFYWRINPTPVLSTQDVIFLWFAYLMFLYFTFISLVVWTISHIIIFQLYFLFWIISACHMLAYFLWSWYFAQNFACILNIL